jgi:hypothetical protein
MATRTDIIDLRIQIADPPDVIRIYEVAILSDLPEVPVPQTAYYVAATGLYYQTEKTSDVVPSDYSFIKLQLPDVTLASLIDSLGDGAKRRALIRIAGRLASQLPIVRNTAGAESTEFLRLLDLYKYYKSLAEDAAEEEAEDGGTSTSRILRIRRPRIAGGNL